MEFPSAPIVPIDTIILSEHDMESGQIIPINNLIQRHQRQTFRNQITCKIIINGIIYILLMCAVAFIIYEHHKIIGLYLGKIDDVKM